MKLHVGCGPHYLQGWTNFDERNDPKNGIRVDVEGDAAKLIGINLLSCDVIYASHLLEHFHRSSVVEVLRTWRSRLKGGGRLWVSVPDYDTLARWHLRRVQSGTADAAWMERMNAWVGGGQNYSGNFHYVQFNEPYMRDRLKHAGFNGIVRMDGIPIPGLSDYSTLHIDGEPISLNIEARRPE